MANVTSATAFTGGCFRVLKASTEKTGKTEKTDERQPDPRAGRVVVPRDMTRAAYMDAAELGRSNPALKLWPLEDARGRSVCWRVGQQSADEFMAASGIEARRVLFHSPMVKIFVPVHGLYFAVRKVELKEKQATVRAILRAVETVWRQAAALHVVSDLGRPHATAVDVRDQLADVAVCRLLCKRAGGANHIFLFSQGQARR